MKSFLLYALVVLTLLASRAECTILRRLAPKITNIVTQASPLAGVVHDTLPCDISGANTVIQKFGKVLQSKTELLGRDIHPFKDNSDGQGVTWDQPRGKLPFPSWLTEFTGLTEWPGMNPPYIPLSFIDFSTVPSYQDIPIRGFGDCSIVKPEHCSFDCNHCARPDEIYTCSKLSQTFDDGPSEWTPLLLDSLKHKATFFTLGISIAHFPEMLQKTFNEGHLIGSHTWSHSFLPSLTNEEIVTQIEWSIWAMNATIGVIPKYFRPPYGGIDDRSRAILRQFGLTTVLWDHDTFDWKLVNSEISESSIASQIEMWKRAGNGGIVLEHDSFEKTVNAGKHFAEIIGPDQLTVAQCVGGRRYLNLE